MSEWVINVNIVLINPAQNPKDGDQTFMNATDLLYCWLRVAMKL